ncbi:MAG: vWA domain-containing protein [Micromonosporaceae bacterium]
MTATVDLATLAARFGARLRAAGLGVGPERSARFAAAVTLVRPAELAQLYHCALATLVGDPADIPILDRVFALVFGGFADPAAWRGDANAPQFRAGSEPAPPPPRRQKLPASAPMPGAQSGGATGEREPPTGPESPYPALAAAAERLGSRDFATLSPAELAELTAVMHRLRLATPLRRSRRYQPGARGRRIDLRTTLRQAQRSGGYPVRLARHRLRDRPRRLVVLCDISGSMEPYARAMLQLLYCAAGGPRAEVFTFATRLTRLTKVLGRARPDLAFERAGRAAPDWSGGTRIGEAVKAFIDRYGNRGMARGAVVFIMAGGWVTGDAAGRGEQMARLSRLAYRVVWANPRTASPRYEPLVAGMAAAWPYCDVVVSAHSVAALDALLTALSGPGPGHRDPGNFQKPAPTPANVGALP